MRGGVLLAEEPPVQLMERCGCSDLEEAFLTLSHKQETKPKVEVCIVAFEITLLNICNIYFIKYFFLLRRS